MIIQMQSIRSIEQLLYTEESPESLHQTISRQTAIGVDLLQRMTRFSFCIQQFSMKTPISVMITSLKPEKENIEVINPQSFPLLNTSLLSDLTQEFHQHIFLFHDLLYRKLQQKEVNESLLIFVVICKFNNE